ncbi:MAG: FAD-dependent oxidoreductase [Betaproteobacteria bacterium]
MQRVILAGAGHAHAQVLQAWSKEPLAGVDLVVVSPQALAPYSGMVPGWLAGTYGFEEIVIDFPALCSQAGARWVPAAIDRLDPDKQCVHLDSGESLRYDWLSLNTGSTLTPPEGEFSANVLSMRPLSQLRTDYDRVLDHWRTEDSDRPFQVTAVGGGAAGFESLLAVLWRLRMLRFDRCVQGALLTRGLELLPGYPANAQRAALRALKDADVTVQLGTSWCDATGRGSDLVLWATGAQAHTWQRDPNRRGSLATSAGGFVLIDTGLRSVSHPYIFAAGDCAQWHTPLPKAGVYAVRMGAVLTHNLRAALTGATLQPYTPQSTYLSLLSTADGRAIASRGRLSLSGRWAWRWKDRIDRRFVRRFASDSTRPIHLQGEIP